MKQSSLITLAAGVAGITLPIILIAVAVLLLVIVGIIFFVRSSGKKKDASSISGNVSDWQPGAAGAGAGSGAWNSQQGGWGQQNQWGAPAQQQQTANPWGSSSTGPQNPWGAPAQPQTGNPWGSSPDQQQQSWGSPAAQQQSWGGQQQPQTGNPWGSSPDQQQQSWGAPAAQQQSWGGQQQPQTGNPWGTPASQQSNPWDATSAAGPQDSWGQQSQQPQQAWGMQGASAAPAQQNVPAWGQPQSVPAGAQSGGFQGPGVANAPSWQQQPGGGFAQQGGFGTPDVDKTMLRPNPAGPAPQTGGLGYVQVKEGKEPGRIYEIRKESLSIGRSRESDIFLEDLAVSRLHASIVNMGNGNYALKDEGSANGTKVNDQLVNKFQTYPLQVGDRIQLGQTVLVFAKR